MAPPSLGRPRRRVDRDAARGDRGPDDGGLSEPELRRPAGALHADAGGLRAGKEPANPHRQGAPAAGQLPPAKRGLLPHRGPQAARQQADGPEAVPGRNQRLGRRHPPQRAAAVHVQQHQECVATVAAKLVLQFTDCSNFTLQRVTYVSMFFCFFFLN